MHVRGLTGCGVVTVGASENRIVRRDTSWEVTAVPGGSAHRVAMGTGMGVMERKIFKGSFL